MSGSRAAAGGRRAIAWIAALLALAGCTARVGGEGVANVPGEEIWKRDVELVAGMTAYVDEDFEITLDSVREDAAVVLFRTEEGTTRRTLEPGVENAARVSPYEVRLLEVRPDGVTLEVRKEWGR